MICLVVSAVYGSAAVFYRQKLLKVKEAHKHILHLRALINP